MAEHPRATSESDKLIGEVLANRYQVESRLGEGAMGAVYKARHIKVGRAFAVKVLHPRLLNEEKLLHRFEREAELAGKLRHPNVIGVVDVGETPDGMHYMVMDFAAGPDLATILSDAPLPAPRVISLTRQLLDGLQHAHEQGLIHRDFKPENVIVETDQNGNELPRIVDFGIAILADAGESAGSEGRLTTNGLVLGTPHYMAPEQAVADPIDHRIDLFALGIILYEMLTGRLPFDGTGAEVARANLVLDPPLMAKRVPHLDVDPLLEAFTRKLMAKNRDLRPDTARDARELLDLITNDRVSAAQRLGISLADARVPQLTQPVRAAHTDEPAAEARTGVTDLDAPPLQVPVARQQVSSRATEMATPLPWREGGKRRGLIIGGVAAGAVVVGLIAIAVKGGKSHDARKADDHVVQTQPAIPAAPTPVVTAPTTDVVTPTAPTSPTSPTTPTTAMGSATGSGSAITVAIAPPGPTEPETPGKPTNPAVPTTATTAPTTPTTPTTMKTVPSVKQATHVPVTHVDDSQVGTHAPATRPPTQSTMTESTSQVSQSSGTGRPATGFGDDTSSNGVARTYGMVGAELKALEDKRGADATSDLWPRFRLIRIADAMTSADKRTETAAALAKLHRDISVRMK